MKTLRTGSQEQWFRNNMVLDKRHARLAKQMAKKFAIAKAQKIFDECQNAQLQMEQDENYASDLAVVFFLGAFFPSRTGTSLVSMVRHAYVTGRWCHRGCATLLVSIFCWFACARCGSVGVSISFWSVAITSRTKT